MPIYKLSKKTHEQFKGWHLIYPTGSSQSTKDTPPPKDSAEKPSSASPEHSTGKED